MAADATLVNMAYKEAMSDVRQFNPEVAKIRAELPGMVTDALVGAIQAKNEENKAENKRQNDLKDLELDKFTGDADRINKYLSTYERGGQGAAMHEQIYNNTYDYLEELKKEYELYNTVGDDDTVENRKQRISILGKLDSAKNSVVQLRSYVQEIAKLGGDANGGSALSKTNIGRSDLHFIDEVINMDGDYTNVKQSWDKEKNEIVFEVTIPKEKFDTLDPEDKKKGQIRKMTVSEMKKVFDEALIPEKLETAILEQRNSYIESARKGQTNFGTLQDSADATKNVIGNNKAGASHIFMNRMDGSPSEGYGAPNGSTDKWKKGSWANALESHPALNGKYNVNGQKFEHDLSAGTKKEVIDDLIASEQVQKSDVDTDGKGGITTDEYEAFMDGANRDLAIDALVNYKNPAYDHELSVKEFSLWNAKLNKAKFDKNQKTKKNTGGSGSGKGSEPLFEDYSYIKLGPGSKDEQASYTGPEATQLHEFIKTGATFPFFGNLYSYENGNWYEQEGDESTGTGYSETKTLKGNAKNLVLNVLNTLDPRFVNLKTEKIIRKDMASGKEVVKTDPESEAKKKIYKNIFDKIAIADIDDDDAATALNELLDLNKGSSKLKFMPYSFTATESALRTGAGGTGIFSADAAGTDDLMLYNPRTGEVVKDSNGDRIRFETGENIKELSEDGSSAQIEKIINTLIEQGIKIPGLNDEDPTKEMSAKEKIQYYIDNPKK